MSNVSSASPLPSGPESAAIREIKRRQWLLLVYFFLLGAAGISTGLVLVKGQDDRTAMVQEVAQQTERAQLGLEDKLSSTIGSRVAAATLPVLSRFAQRLEAVEQKVGGRPRTTDTPPVPPSVGMSAIDEIHVQLVALDEKFSPLLNYVPAKGVDEGPQGDMLRQTLATTTLRLAAQERELQLVSQRLLKVEARLADLDEIERRLKKLERTTVSLDEAP